MISARLGPELERKLKAAARVQGVSESQLIREAVSERCAQVLARRRPIDRFGDSIGKFRGEGLRADISNEELAEIVAEEANRKRRP